MLKVKKLHPDAKLPTRNENEDLGFDLYCLEEVVIKSGEITKVKTGISATFIPTRGEGGVLYGLIIKDRSSMAAKGVFTHAGVIDPSYTGEIVVVMSCLCGSGPNQFVKYTYPAGSKIAQMVPVIKLPGTVVEVEDLGVNSQRQAGGFGSTGV